MIQGDSHRSDLSARATKPARGRLLALRRLGTLGGAVLLAVGLAACNDAQADPDPLDTIETDPQPDPEPEPAEDEPDDDESGPGEYEHPEPGPDIDDDGQAGAEAAAVYFVELFSYVHATGDFGAWDDLTTADCNFCRDVGERIGDLYSEGGHGLADPPVFDSVTAHVWESTPGDYSVEVLFNSPAIETFDSGGQVVRTYEEIPTRTWVLVEFRDQVWRILGAESGSVE